MKYRQRLLRLEMYQRKRNGSPHYVSVVHYPWDLPDGDCKSWLREELRCAYGQVGCPEMMIGLLAPAKAPSVEAWAARAQAYYSQRKGSDA
jgi:hypothetical protein